eukprot:m51a1_g12702 putative pleckstrin domain-containing protein (546) ;mRNA; f:1-2039
MDEKQKLLKKRSKIAAEIVDTEQTYVGHLNMIITKYLSPLRMLKISKADLFNVFSNVEVIRNCHAKFLEKLSERLENWSETTTMGDVFLNDTQWIKLYKYYINNYDNAQETLQKCKDNCSEFRDYIESMDHTDAVEGKPLESLLIVPVQRIPRYVLLLQELVKTTPPSHRDTPLLNEAISFIKDLADYINEKKRVYENQNKLESIQKRWRKFPGDLLSSPGRSFVKEIPVSSTWSKLILWLFNDVVIATSGEATITGKYTWKSTTKLATAALQYETGSTSFRLLGPEIALSGTCDPEDIKVLESTIEAAQDLLLMSTFRRNSVVSVDATEVSQQFLEFQKQELRQRRLKNLRELITSERAYQTFVESAFHNLLDPLNRDPDLITDCFATAFKEIHGFFKHASLLHKEFYQRLEERSKAWEHNDNINDILSDLMPGINAYGRYAQRHRDHLALLEQALSSDAVFAQWLRSHEESCGMRMVEVTERVLRRVPEYYLALQEMTQNTPPRTRDFHAISKATMEIDTLRDAMTRKADAKLAAILGMPTRK